MLIRRNTGRPFAPLISSSDFSEKSSVAPTRWRRLFATKGVVYYCFMRSFAVCTSTNSPCPLHQSSNQTPRFDFTHLLTYCPQAIPLSVTFVSWLNALARCCSGTLLTREKEGRMRAE